MCPDPDVSPRLQLDPPGCFCLVPAFTPPPFDRPKIANSLGLLARLADSIIETVSGSENWLVRANRAETDSQLPVNPPQSVLIRLASDHPGRIEGRCKRSFWG